MTYALSMVGTKYITRKQLWKHLLFMRVCWTFSAVTNSIREARCIARNTFKIINNCVGELHFLRASSILYDAYLDSQVFPEL